MDYEPPSTRGIGIYLVCSLPEQNKNNTVAWVPDVTDTRTDSALFPGLYTAHKQWKQQVYNEQILYYFMYRVLIIDHHEDGSLDPIHWRSKLVHGVDHGYWGTAEDSVSCGDYRYVLRMNVVLFLSNYHS